MGIQIEKIYAKGLGPIEEFIHPLGLINLIYGKNECGKTFLVEFLLKSLFKNTKKYNLRRISSTGNVIISGLESGETQFSPSSRYKIEDFWEKAQQGLPTNMAQLLVVKGADLNFPDNISCGISKNIVEEFLSSERILDDVQGKISKTVQAAQIENGEIIGRNMGEIKNRNDTLRELEDAEALINKVSMDYSSGRLISLLKRKEDLEANIEEQDKAKRFLAYSLSGEIRELEEENSNLKTRGFLELDKLFSDLCDKKNSLKKKETEFKEAEGESVYYKWITAAIDEYEKLLDQGLKPANHTYQIMSLIMFCLSGLLATIGLVLHVLNHNPGYFVFFIGIGLNVLLGLLFGFLYNRQQIINQSQFAKSSELNRIEESYLDKFGEKLTEIAALKTRQKNIQDAYYLSQHVANEIKEYKSAIKGIEKELSAIFNRLGFKDLDPSLWEKHIDQLGGKFDQNTNSINSLKIEKASLGVSADEELTLDPGTEFDKDELTRLSDELNQLKDDISNEENNLENLKTEIRTLVSDRSNSSWEELLEKLNNFQNDKHASYKEITSQILAGIVVSQVIDEIRSVEDEKLQIALNSEQIRKPLFNITKRYNRISLGESNLIISDKFESFDIADLSTGAREQVLLALRLGFASRIMKGETAFLILDDAFQHSDWDRRKYLLQTVMGLAKSGWQIIYFTMDDHIMHLFNEACEKRFQSDYHFINLE